MKLGLLGYIPGSISNRTSKIGINKLEKSTLGLTSNRNSIPVKTRKSGIYRPEDNGTKQYYKGDIQSFDYDPVVTIYSISATGEPLDQPSGLDARPNGLYFYGVSGRSDEGGSPSVSLSQIFLPKSEPGQLNTYNFQVIILNVLVNGVYKNVTYWPELHAVKFRPSDGKKLFGVGTLTRQIDNDIRYFGTVFYIWSLSTGWDISTIPSGYMYSVPFEYYFVNQNGNSPSSTPIDDPDISNGAVGAGGLRVKDTFMHPDGNIFYYLSNDVIYQGSLNTAWYLGSGSAPGAQVTSLNTSSLTVTPNDYSVNAFTFSSDGKKLYTLSASSASNHTIQQYNLSTAWQLSSASISNNSVVTRGGDDDKRIGIRILDDQSTIITLSRIDTSSGTGSNGYLHTLNQALY